MLELGKPGSAGTRRGERPALRDGAVVARLRAANWRERATALVGDRDWVFTKKRRALVGRRAADPDGTARLRARPTSFWRGTWAADLEGTTVERRKVSVWKGTHRYLAGDREVAQSGTTGGWSRRPTLTADDSLPLDHQVFLLWVELVIRRRRADSSAAAGAGAAGGS